VSEFCLAPCQKNGHFPRKSTVSHVVEMKTDTPGPWSGGRRPAQAHWPNRPRWVPAVRSASKNPLGVDQGIRHFNHQAVSSGWSNGPISTDRAADAHPGRLFIHHTSATSNAAPKIQLRRLARGGRFKAGLVTKRPRKAGQRASRSDRIRPRWCPRRKAGICLAVAEAICHGPLTTSSLAVAGLAARAPAPGSAASKGLTAAPLTSRAVSYGLSCR